MGKINDGGPAFPRTTKTYTADNGDDMHEGVPGMSLRDYLAAQAMKALLIYSYQSGWKEHDEIAMHAFRMADAMIQERGAA